MIVAAHQTMLAPQETWPVPLYTGVNLVGSSVQNNNGILSGFTSSSYATMPYYMTSGATSLEAVIKFHWNGSNSANAGIWGCVGSANSFTPFYYEALNNTPRQVFGSYLSSNGTTWTIAVWRGHWSPQPPSAGYYVLKLVWSGGTVTYYRWTGSAWVLDMAASIASIYGASNLVPQLGTNRGQNNPLDGSIDLNYTYLFRDGELWWEGVAGSYRNVKTTYPD